jgi:chromosome partitioning protein
MNLAVVNNKGGVGKTTTAVSLAAALAHSGRPVLLVDLDSQASASLSLGVARANLTPSAADVVLHNKPIRQALRHTSMPNLDLLTGSRALADTDLVLSTVKRREYCLKAALDPIRSVYAWMILDCPPSLSVVTVNALVAANAFLVPVTPQYLALEGLVGLLEAIERIRRSTRAGAYLMGVVLNMVDLRTKASGEIIDLIRTHYKTLVFNTEIRTTARLLEAPSFGKTIFQYAPRSAAAEAYKRLTGEVLARASASRH